MEELSQLMLEYFKESKKVNSIYELRKIFSIKGETQTNIFNDALASLVEDGSLFFNGKNYRLFTNDIGFAFGQIEINKAGNGFVQTKDGYKIFIEQKDLNGALNRDKVIVSSIVPSRRNEFKGEIHQVVKRNTGNVIFEVIGNGYNATLVPYNKFESINVEINRNNYKDLIDGDLVLVKADTKNIDNYYKGYIEKVIGHKDDPNIDIQLLASKYEVPVEFPSDVIEEAKLLPKEVTEKDTKGRIDLRDKNIITIDCDNTKDRDDAIYVEKLHNGNYKLIVSIAAVNYYIKKGSKLYEEVLKRNTSHYVNNTCIPMLPHIISNGICSLSEHVDRLTKSVEMEIDCNGDVVDYKIYNSIINSKKAMKYSEVNKVLNNSPVEGYEKFVNDLMLMNELSNILEKSKKERSYLDFNIPDIDIVQDKVGKTVNFEPSGIGCAQKIIENFMVIADETVAKHYSWLIPFIFRVHDEPNENNVKNTIKLLKDSGFNIPSVKNINSYTLQNLLMQTQNDEKTEIIRTELLKSMKRAGYGTNNIGHFALQLSKYCHFTSPIRRIVDFMLHTTIEEYEELKINENNFELIEKELKEISEKATKYEQIAEDMEAEGLAMEMAAYMEDHIGEEFEAYITQIYRHGMFAKTKNMISGKIKLDDILDDKYYYDKDKRAIIGRSNKKQYKIGTKVCVLVADASKANRTVNFQIGKQKSLRKS